MSASHNWAKGESAIMMNWLEAWRDWRERAQVLRDVRLRRSVEAERLKFVIRDQLTYAIQGLERGDLIFAQSVWNDLIGSHPVETRSSPLALRVLIGLRRFEEAELLTENGMRQFPGEASYVRGYAEVSHAQRKFETALERWALLRKRFPAVIDGYTCAADAYCQLDQMHQAEEMILQALKKLPSELGGHLEHARMASRRQDWEEALKRWKSIQNNFGYFGGSVGVAQALVQLGRFDEADAVLAEARLRFGTEVSIFSEHARVAEARGDVPEALTRWRRLIERFPSMIVAYLDAADALLRLGEPEHATEILRVASDLFPNEPRPLHGLAKLLHFGKCDYPAAAAAWGKLRERFSDNDESYKFGAEALERAGQTTEAEALKIRYDLRFGSQSRSLSASGI